jgi:hypothetical protein
LIFHIFV